MFTEEVNKFAYQFSQNGRNYIITTELLANKLRITLTDLVSRHSYFCEATLKQFGEIHSAFLMSGSLQQIQNEINKAIMNKKIALLDDHLGGAVFVFSTNINGTDMIILISLIKTDYLRSIGLMLGGSNITQIGIVGQIIAEILKSNIQIYALDLAKLISINMQSLTCEYLRRLLYAQGNHSLLQLQTNIPNISTPIQGYSSENEIVNVELTNNIIPIQPNSNSILNIQTSDTVISPILDNNFNQPLSPIKVEPIVNSSSPIYLPSQPQISSSVTYQPPTMPIAPIAPSQPLIAPNPPLSTDHLIQQNPPIILAQPSQEAASFEIPNPYLITQNISPFMNLSPESPGVPTQIHYSVPPPTTKEIEIPKEFILNIQDIQDSSNQKLPNPLVTTDQITQHINSGNVVPVQDNSARLAQEANQNLKSELNRLNNVTIGLKEQAEFYKLQKEKDDLEAQKLKDENLNNQIKADKLKEENLNLINLNKQLYISLEEMNRKGDGLDALQKQQEEKLENENLKSELDRLNNVAIGFKEQAEFLKLQKEKDDLEAQKLKDENLNNQIKADKLNEENLNLINLNKQLSISLEEKNRKVEELEALQKQQEEKFHLEEENQRELLAQQYENNLNLEKDKILAEVKKYQDEKEKELQRFIKLKEIEEAENKKLKEIEDSELYKKIENAQSNKNSISTNTISYLTVGRPVIQPIIYVNSNTQVSEMSAAGCSAGIGTGMGVANLSGAYAKSSYKSAACATLNQQNEYYSSKVSKKIIKGEILKDFEELDLLTKHINKNNKKITYELIYKATVDGDTAKSFHERCDNAQSTLVLVQSTSGKRFGGFTTKSWEGNRVDKKDNEAFVFSLDKKEIYDIIKDELAIGCYPKYGPVFFGCQIRIMDNFFEKGGTTYEAELNYHTTSDFVLTGGERKFIVKELEVYDVKIE